MDAKGYSPMRRWLRQEQARDLEARNTANSSCTACGRQLYRMDDNGNVIGSCFILGDRRECWTCHWTRLFAEQSEPHGLHP